MCFICALIILQSLTDSFYFNKDFAKMQEQGHIPNYNWERGLKIIPYAKHILGVLVFIRIPICIAFAFCPSIANIYFPLILLYQVIFNFLPIDYGETRTRLFTDSIYVLLMALFTSIKFRPSLILIILYVILGHFIVQPLMNRDEVLSGEQIADKIIFNSMSIFVFICLECVVTLTSNLLE